MTIHPETNKAYSLLHNGILSLARAEQQGIRVDIDYIIRKKAHLTRRIAHMEEVFKQTNFYKRWEHSSKAKVNINSNAQLSHYLYNVKKLIPEKTTKNSDQGSTDEEALKRLNIPELDDLLAMRKLKKIRDTYLDGFLKESVDGYIHPFYNLHLVRTFRSSSDSPNFQNIPKRDEEAMRICRRAIFPRPGHQLLEVDFSGAEIKISACYHKDPVMLKYLHDPKSDMLGDMANEIFKIKIDKNIPAHYTMRQAAKNGFIFPQFYGDYYKNNAIGICEWMKLPQTRWTEGQGIEMPKGHVSDHLIAQGLKEFGESKKDGNGKWVLTGFLKHMKEVEDAFWSERFKVYAQWKGDWYAQYKKQGYIDMFTGFRCSGVMSRNDVINYPVQGAAFHCLLWVFTQIDYYIKKEKLDTRLIGQIHDSLIFDCLPEETEQIAKTAKHLISHDLAVTHPWIIVPMSADFEISPIDQPWSEKETYKI